MVSYTVGIRKEIVKPQKLHPLCHLCMGENFRFLAFLVCSKDVHSYQIYLVYGICINKSEQTITKFIKEEGLVEIVIGNIFIILLLYANVVLFANTLEDTQKLMRTLEEFCMHIKLSANSSKTKIMLEMSQIKDKQCTMYNYEQLETTESFKYLGLEVPSCHWWNQCQ